MAFHVKEIPSNNYGRIIEINIPVRFYWDKNGSFDGIEFSTSGISKSESSLLDEVVTQMKFLSKGYKEWNIKDILDE